MRPGWERRLTVAAVLVVVGAVGALAVLAWQLLVAIGVVVLVGCSIGHVVWVLLIRGPE